MRTIKLTVAYDGKDFHGWQVQPALRTVQGEIEKAVEQITGESIRIMGAGRTDAGVHALGQAASFSTTSSLSCRKLCDGLDAVTPEDIAVIEAYDVPENFDARHDAVSKLYRYCIHNSRSGHPLRRRTHLHVKACLDIPAMSDAAGMLEGSHDFAGFRAADCDREETVLPLYRCEILKGDADEIRLEVEGPAFMKHMVRVITGTLVEIARGRMEPGHVLKILETGDRTIAGPTAAAHGLTLVRVDYDKDWIRKIKPA